MFNGEFFLKFEDEGAVALGHVEEGVAFVSIHALAVEGGPVAVDGELGIPQQEESIERGGFFLLESRFNGKRDPFEQEGDTGDGMPAELDWAEVDEPFLFLGAEDAEKEVEVGRPEDIAFIAEAGEDPLAGDADEVADSGVFLPFPPGFLDEGLGDVGNLAEASFKLVFLHRGERVHGALFDDLEHVTSEDGGSAGDFFGGERDEFSFRVEVERGEFGVLGGGLRGDYQRLLAEGLGRLEGGHDIGERAPAEVGGAEAFAREGVVVFPVAFFLDELFALFDERGGDVEVFVGLEAAGEEPVHVDPDGSAPIAMPVEAFTAVGSAGDTEVVVELTSVHEMFDQGFGHCRRGGLGIEGGEATDRLDSYRFIFDLVEAVKEAVVGIPAVGLESFAGLVGPRFEKLLVLGVIQDPGEDGQVMVGAGPERIEQDVSQSEGRGLQHGGLVPAGVAEVVNEAPVEVVVVVRGALPVGYALGVGATGGDEILGQVVGEEVILGAVELGAVVHAAFPGMEYRDEADVVGVADGFQPVVEFFDSWVEMLEEFEVVGFGEDDAGG